MKELLSVTDLEIARSDSVRLVDKISFSIPERNTLAFVGESGCGKSITALSLMGLLSPGLRVAGGTAMFRGQNLANLNESEMSRLRGNRMAMIFQEPMTSLNPILTVGEQIGEVVRQHQGLNKRSVRERAIELLRMVGIPDPSSRVNAFPHQLSGGQRQRVMIASAIACDPNLLIADEPTTALDVTVQAAILALLKDLQARFNLALLLITHDFGVVKLMADRVLVMYAGNAIEEGPTAKIISQPLHPYTQLLLAARPRADQNRYRDRLADIRGMPPPLTDRKPPGCRFAPRCPLVEERCKKLDLANPIAELNHKVACVKPHAY